MEQSTKDLLVVAIMLLVWLAACALSAVRLLAMH